MTNWSENFKRETREEIDWTGVHAFQITDVAEGVSKTSGLPMLIISTEQSKSGIKCTQYIVKNDFFNQNMTELFNALDEVEFGDFDFTHWIGKVGVARYKRDKKGFITLGRFLAADSEDAIQCETFIKKQPKLDADIEPEINVAELPF